MANVSHELRTPLTSILGFARLVEKRLSERLLPGALHEDPQVSRSAQQAKENLEIIIAESQRLTTLINDVLDLEKIEAGKMEWHMQPVRLAEIISQAAASSAGLFEGTSLALSLDLPEMLPVVIGDRDKLMQVVINLISNAVKFTPRGKVTIQARQKDTRLVVSVVDTGFGITSEDQPKVFDNFKQVGDSLTSKPRGTGLGLPIVKEIVEHHGGEVWVESTPGMGSRLSFSLPLAAGSPGSDPGQRLVLTPLVRQLVRHVINYAKKVEGKSACIQLVTANQSLMDLLRRELTVENYQIITASGKQAKGQKSESLPADLILLDTEVTGESGPDLATMIQKDPWSAGLPVITLNIIEDETHSKRVTPDRYLTRMADFAETLVEVRSLVGIFGSDPVILVVDPSPSTRDAVQAALVQQGLLVYTGADVENCITFITNKRPDLVLVNTLLLNRNELVWWARSTAKMEAVLFVFYPAMINP